MLLSLAPLLLSVSLVGDALAADTCALQGTQWLQDGALRGSADGPALALATSSPELLAALAVMSSEPPEVRIHLEDSVAVVDATMRLDELRVRARRPLSFADDTIYTGQADLRVRAVEASGVLVAPTALPPWIEVSGSPSATVACGDLDLVESWPGDLRPLAIGSADRGSRVYLKAGEAIEVSRIPGTSPATTLHPDRAIPVEAVSKDAQAVRIVARFDGGLVVGWVRRDAISDEAGEAAASEEPAPSPAVEVPGTVAICKKGGPLWVSAGGEERIFGTLNEGTGVVFGEKAEDRVYVLAVRGATAWAPAPEARWWLDAKVARGCK